ncbi:MAG: GNAT family N-acetyltransferase [Bacteroidota bacterium]
MEYRINQELFLSTFSELDAPSLVRWLNDQTIYDNTYHIPHPYTRKDALEFILKTKQNTQREGKAVNFAIRHKTDGLIGGIGFFRGESNAEHSRDIGYWLAAPYRGQGIMGKAIVRLVQYLSEEWQVQRVVATVIESNDASRRVLEKAGFLQEGFLRKRFQKNGVFLNVYLYALLVEAKAKP